MKFGLFNLMSYQDNPGGVGGIISNTRDMISMAEQIGFDIAWFAEHHFTNYSVSVSPLMMCAHFAGLTKKIRLGAGVVVLPLYHPMRVAQEIGLVVALPLQVPQPLVGLVHEGRIGLDGRIRSVEARIARRQRVSREPRG